MTLSPDFSMCLAPHKGERWGHKILFRGEECLEIFINGSQHELGPG